MTKPLDEQYEIDRDLAAMTTPLDKPLIAQAIFCKGADWCKQYFDAKVLETIGDANQRIETELDIAYDKITTLEQRIEEQNKTIAELAGALEFLHKNVGSNAYSHTDLWGDVMERVYRTTRDALTTHAEAIKRAKQGDKK